jgi:LPXTG-motif cell wall-anchored protein
MRLRRSLLVLLTLVFVAMMSAVAVPAQAATIEQSVQFSCTNSASGGTVQVTGTVGLAVGGDEGTASIPAGCFGADEQVVWKCTADEGSCPIGAEASVRTDSAGGFYYASQLTPVSATCYSMVARGMSSGATASKTKCISAAQAAAVNAGMVANGGLTTALAITGVVASTPWLLAVGAALVGVGALLVTKTRSRRRES